MQNKDDEILYWRDRYFSILNQNQQLREKNAELTQSVADLNDKSNKDQSLIDELQLQIHYLMKPNPLNVSAQQIDELAQTLCGSSSSLQNSITRALAMKNAQENQNPFIPPIYEESKIDKIFEEFYILGVKENRKVKAGSIDAEILYQYPIINIRSSSAQARALGNFSFPSGISARFLGLNDSASDVHEVLRPHQKREGNSFVFTLKSSGKEDKFPFNNIANREKELLYCCCVIIEDLSTDQNAENSHIILPKCYCIVSYCPTFELHFEILFKLLSIKQIQRLSNISEKERSPYNRGSIESVFQIQNLISDEEIGLLQDYYNSSHFSPNANINIGLLSIDDFKYTVPADLTVLDSSWFCPLLFSLLDFKDFFWILSALMHEKSVVFVSKNLDHVSSCVLGFHALLRPFNWTHLLTPVIPDSLRDVLEAPVPLLVGMPSPGPNITKKYSHIIWVLLDELKASKKVVKSGATQKSVKEPAADNLKAKLSIPYKKFTGVKPCYTPSNEQRNACDLIITEITNCWYSIIRKLPRLPFKIDNESLDIDELGRYLVENSAPGDVKFLENVINTQLFVNAVEEFYNLV